MLRRHCRARQRLRLIHLSHNHTYLPCKPTAYKQASSAKGIPSSAQMIVVVGSWLAPAAGIVRSIGLGPTPSPPLTQGPHAPLPSLPTLAPSLPRRFPVSLRGFLLRTVAPFPAIGASVCERRDSPPFRHSPTFPPCPTNSQLTNYPADGAIAPTVTPRSPVPFTRLAWPMAVPRNATTGSGFPITPGMSDGHGNAVGCDRSGLTA